MGAFGESEVKQGAEENVNRCLVDLKSLQSVQPSVTRKQHNVSTYSCQRLLDVLSGPGDVLQNAVGSDILQKKSSSVSLRLNSAVKLLKNEEFN